MYQSVYTLTCLLLMNFTPWTENHPNANTPLEASAIALSFKPSICQSQDLFQGRTGWRQLLRPIPSVPLRHELSKEGVCEGRTAKLHSQIEPNASKSDMSFLEDRDWRVGQSINSLGPENNETSPCKDSLACTVYCSPTSIHRKIHWKPRHNDHQCQRQSHTNFGHGRPQRSAAVASLQAPQVALVCFGDDSLIPLGRLCLQKQNGRGRLEVSSDVSPQNFTGAFRLIHMQQHAGAAKPLQSKNS